jgi:hypothetical protein
MFTLHEIDRLIPFSSFANFALNPGLEFKLQLMELQPEVKNIVLSLNYFHK